MNKKDKSIIPIDSALANLKKIGKSMELTKKVLEEREKGAEPGFEPRSAIFREAALSTELFCLELSKSPKADMCIHDVRNRNWPATSR